MLSQNVVKWVEALRSGKYKQAKNRLSTGEGQCCLGVACYIAKENGLDVEIEPTYCGGEESFNGQINYLPENVRKWLGLCDPQGSFQDGNTINQLAMMNDSGETFETIAKKIESEPSGLFCN